MRHAIGIDHGTTFSSAAALREDRTVPEMIELGQGQNQIPSVICIDDSASPPDETIGAIAENQDRVHPEQVMKWYKPLMELKPEETFLGRDLENLAAVMLRGIKDQIERRINEELESAVITVPAWFHDRARKTTIAAANAAGIADVRLENEPTAAAYFCHRQKPLGAGQVMMVYDLGGGTFDTSVVRFNEDGTLQVLASCGDMDLGGHLWTLKLQEFIAPRYHQDHDIDLLANTAGQYDVYHACEAAKRALSLMSETQLRLLPENGPREQYEVTRAEFESLTQDLMDRTGTVMSESLARASLKWTDVHEILLVGGATNMPQVKEYIQQETGGVEIRELGDRNQLVAQGASLLQRQRLDAKSSGKAGGTVSGVEIDGVKRSTAHNLSTWVVKDSQLQYAVVVNHGQQIPAEGTRRFQRQRDKATEIQIPVFEGGEDRAAIDLRQDISGYRTLWRFHNIPPTPVEKDEIEVCFRYTEQQTTEVDARYKPGTDEEVILSGVEEDWEEMKDLDEGGLNAEIPLVVAIDCSGSMHGARIAEAKSELGIIADQYLSSNFTLSVVAFPHRIFGNAGEVIRCSREPGAVKREVGELVAGGGTPMDAGLQKAHEVIDAISDNGAQRYVFLITDGAPSDVGRTERAAEAIRADGIKLYGIPIKPGERGMKVLEQICDKTEPIDTAAGISKAFRNLLTGS